MTEFVDLEPAFFCAVTSAATAFVYWNMRTLH